MEVCLSQQQNGKGSGDWKAPDGDGGSSKGEEGRFGFPKWEEPEVAETGKEAFVDTELGRIMEDADELVIADAPRAPPPPRWQRPPPPKLEAYSAPWPRKTRPPFHAVLQSHRGQTDFTLNPASGQSLIYEWGAGGRPLQGNEMDPVRNGE